MRFGSIDYGIMEIPTSLISPFLGNIVMPYSGPEPPQTLYGIKYDGSKYKKDVTCTQRVRQRDRPIPRN